MMGPWRAVLFLGVLRRSLAFFGPARRDKKNLVMALRSRASDLLYNDHQEAMARCAEDEKVLLGPNAASFTAFKEGDGAPKKKTTSTKRGSGFKAQKPVAAAETRPRVAETAAAQRRVLKRDGCVRIAAALDPSTAAALLDCVVSEVAQVKLDVESAPETARERFGLEPERRRRCVVLLPLLAAELSSTRPPGEPDAIVTALRELLGTEVEASEEEGVEVASSSEGSIGGLLSAVCGGDGAPLYELCALVTEPGALRQTVHADTPHQEHSPLYAAFVALQAVTLEMGPTTFLPRTHTYKSGAKERFERGSDAKAAMLSTAPSSLAICDAGDAFVFDMRVLHAGAANEGDPDSAHGGARALFNLTFRNRAATRSVGHVGSLLARYKSHPPTLAELRRELGGPRPFEAEREVPSRD